MGVCPDWAGGGSREAPRGRGGGGSKSRLRRPPPPGLRVQVPGRQGVAEVGGGSLSELGEPPERSPPCPGAPCPCSPLQYSTRLAKPCYWEFLKRSSAFRAQIRVLLAWGLRAPGALLPPPRPDHSGRLAHLPSDGPSFGSFSWSLLAPHCQSRAGTGPRKSAGPADPAATAPSRSPGVGPGGRAAPGRMQESGFVWSLQAFGAHGVHQSVASRSFPCCRKMARREHRRVIPLFRVLIVSQSLRRMYSNISSFSAVTGRTGRNAERCL